ncbi:MAG: hypothetical protein IKF16_10325 [Lachnospiraceae bacterium]|nr:hypothetical protein [Lachnospiraceae bacterium]
MTDKYRIGKRITAALLLFFAISFSVPAFAAAIPKAPRYCTAKSVDGCILISWSARKDVSGYRIYRRKIGKKRYKFLKKVDDRYKTYCRDKTAVPGSIYEYAVSSYRKTRRKKLCSIKTAAGNAVMCMPGAPVITRFKNSGGKVTMKWTSARGADGYRIEKKVAGTSKWVKVRDVSAKKTKLVMEKGKKSAVYAVRTLIRRNGKILYTSERSPSVSDAGKKYTGQKILFIGDSITWGYVGKKKQAAVPFPERVRQLTGASYKNAGIPGCNFARKKLSDKKSIIARTMNGSVNYSGYTTIVLACGTNDYANNVKLGSYSDAGVSTFCGAVNETIREIKEQNPDAQIVLITPIYRIKMKKKWSSKGGYRTKNKTGHTLLDYCRAVRVLAKKHNVRCYDSQNRKIFTAQNAKYLLNDGLHPTQEGYIVLGDSVAGYLKKIMKKD